MIKSVEHYKVKLKPEIRDESDKLVSEFSRSSISPKQNHGIYSNE